MLQAETRILGQTAGDFNGNAELITVFKKAVVSGIDGISVDDVYDVSAQEVSLRARRRADNEDSVAALVHYKVKTSSRTASVEAASALTEDSAFTAVLRSLIVSENVEIGVPPRTISVTKDPAKIEVSETKVSDSPEGGFVDGPTADARAGGSSSRSDGDDDDGMTAAIAILATILGAALALAFMRKWWQQRKNAGTDIGSLELFESNIDNLRNRNTWDMSVIELKSQDEAPSGDNEVKNGQGASHLNPVRRT